MSIVANSVFFNSGYDVSFSRLPLVNNSVTDVMHDVLPDPSFTHKGENVVRAKCGIGCFMLSIFHISIEHR